MDLNINFLPYLNNNKEHIPFLPHCPNGDIKSLDNSTKIAYTLGSRQTLTERTEFITAAIIFRRFFERRITMTYNKTFINRTIKETEVRLS